MIALVAVVFALVASAALADTSDLEWNSIEVNGHDVEYSEDGTADEMIAVEEGETLEVEVGLEALADVEDVEVEIEISGYEYDDYQDLEDESHLFDMESGTTKYVDLEIDLPVQLDKDEYYLRIRVTDKNSVSLEQIVRLYVEPSRNGIEIEDVMLSPGSTVEAGHSLLATVELQNYGSNDEEDVKITIGVDELGISSYDTIDVLEANEDSESVSYETTEELFLSIPDCAAAGVYSLDVTVEYDEYESTTNSYSLTVTDGDYCTEGDEDEERLVLAVGPESQEVDAGEQAVYAIALSNEGTSSESYTLSVSVGSEDLSTSLSESLVVLDASESGVVYAYVSADAEASEGDYPVTILVENDGKTIETISLTLEVEAGSEEAASEEGVSLRNGLEIALIVLVVLLVIVGLIIGFSRLRGSEDEEQTYY
tara:strand:- start:18 stop:1295 length:1278 start_codon:yes stop_codon:yes gene_type:complete